MKNFKIILVVFLAGVAAFTTFEYLMAMKDRSALLNTANQLKGRLTDLQNEKQGLVQELENAKALHQQFKDENSILQDSLKASDEKLASLNTDFSQAQETIKKLNSETTALKTEIASLKQEINNLKKTATPVQ